MYKSKYPSLIDFLTNQEDLILLDSEIQNIENLVDKDLKAITVTRCCKSDSELLKTFPMPNVIEAMERVQDLIVRSQPKAKE